MPCLGSGYSAIGDRDRSWETCWFVGLAVFRFVALPRLPEAAAGAPDLWPQGNPSSRVSQVLPRPGLTLSRGVSASIKCCSRFRQALRPHYGHGLRSLASVFACLSLTDWGKGVRDILKIGTFRGNATLVLSKLFPLAQRLLSICRTTTEFLPKLIAASTPPSERVQADVNRYHHNSALCSRGTYYSCATKRTH